MIYIYMDSMASIEQAIAARDYTNALHLYNNKGLIYQSAAKFAWKGEGFVDYLKRLISDKTGEDVVAAMRPYAPNLS
jgi:hypothetical protein